MKTNSDTEAFLEYIGKSLNEAPGASHSGKHRAAFTALQSLIEAALAQGYTMRATWSALREKKQLSMSYETFRAHCRRAGIGQPQQSAAQPSHARPEPLRTPSGAAPGAGPADGPQRGFRHDRVPRKGGREALLPRHVQVDHAGAGLPSGLELARELCDHAPLPICRGGHDAGGKRSFDRIAQ